MRTFAATALALSLLVWTISGDAQSVQRGYEAAQQGDFETAFQEWYPLAEQGVQLHRATWLRCMQLVRARAELH